MYKHGIFTFFFFFPLLGPHIMQWKFSLKLVIKQLLNLLNHTMEVFCLSHEKPGTEAMPYLILNTPKSIPYMEIRIFS